MNLFEASENGNLDRVRELLTGVDGTVRVDPNIEDEYGQTPLLSASACNCLEVVKELLREGADPNIPNDYGCTSLHRASRNGRLEIVRELLNAGADPNTADIDDRTSTNLASDREVIKELENYFPSLLILSLRHLRKFKIDFSTIPKNLLYPSVN